MNASLPQPPVLSSAKYSAAQPHLRAGVRFGHYRFMQRAVLPGLFFACLGFASLTAAAESPAAVERRLLYVAAPGVRDELDHGGHGILVFDIADRHRFV